MRRLEHPNPQKIHNSFINLNGAWEFQYDNEMVGKDNRFFERAHLDDTIEVPFCPESRLSGKGNTDFINAVWYRKDIVIPAEALSGNVLITFGAVDYVAEIYINGVLSATHIGGYTPIIINATEYLREGTNSLCVYALDDKRNGIARGKQCAQLQSAGCDYTRTTGIWQTVYMEFLPKNYIKNVKLTPNALNCTVTAEVLSHGNGTVKAQVFYKGRLVGTAFADSCNGKTCMDIRLSEKHLWEVGNGRLYDIEFSLDEDVFKSYFGLRDIELKGKKFLINGKSVFQRLVLDQGFYEEGIYTAPTAEDIENDIKLSLLLGFNGARPHMKIFEPLYLYYCDKYGYIAWGEFPNWGLDICDTGIQPDVLSQWREAMDRDYNHPSIVGWCPMNETHITKRNAEEIQVHDGFLKTLYDTTKAFDPARPCIDTSGYIHQIYTDIYDLHSYNQNAEALAKLLVLVAEGKGTQGDHSFDKRGTCTYNGQPLFVSEYGGARWAEESAEGWGYGNAPKTEEEFIKRFADLAEAIMDNENYFGFCYTQLYDIEQEKNGLLYYNRTPKFDCEKIRQALIRPAAIEK